MTAGTPTNQTAAVGGRDMALALFRSHCQPGDRGTLERYGEKAAVAAILPLLTALSELSDLFAHEGESSVDRFERLAAMFRKDTGYLAPGKDQPMCGPDQPGGDDLRAIYDAWYQAKIDRARAALQQAGAGDA